MSSFRNPYEGEPTDAGEVCREVELEMVANRELPFDPEDPPPTVSAETVAEQAQMLLVMGFTSFAGDGITSHAPRWVIRAPGY